MSIAATITLTIIALLAVPAGASAAKRHRHGPGATGTHLSPACASDRPVAVKPSKKGASSHQSAPAGCPTGTTLARLLAAGITHGSATARERGIVNAMRYLHIGVMTASGKPVVTVPEIGAAQYFQLYDFELRGIAQQLISGATESLDTFTARFAVLAGGSSKGSSVSAAAVRRLLVYTSRHAVAHAADPRSRLALLVRALGLRHKGPRYDLARNPAAARIVLDPLQSTLVEIAMVMPALRRMHVDLPHEHARAANAFAGGAAGAGAARARATSLASGCGSLVDAENAAKQWIVRKIGETATGRWISGSAAGYYTKTALKLDWVAHKTWFKKMVSTLGDTLVKVGKSRWTRGFGHLTKWGTQAMAIVNALHDMLLAAGVEVRISQVAQHTHWDHGDGSTGQPMTFSVLVRMDFDLPQTLVKCGPLVGFKVPPKGPIAGVPVSWSDKGAGILGQLFGSDQPLTPDMGTTNCGALPCTTITGANGVAQLVFTPKKEPIPGGGPVYTDSGHIYPTVLYQSAEGGSLFMGQIAQYLFPNGYGHGHWSSPAWTVGYHKVPNLVLDFKATVTPYLLHPSPGSGTFLGCHMDISSITQTGAVTVEGSVPLELISDPNDLTKLTYQGVGVVPPLKHTDTSLEIVEQGTSTDCPPTPDGPFTDHQTITAVHDGALEVGKLVWDSADEVPGNEAGVTAFMEFLDAPTETYYDDGVTDQNRPQQGWLDAVNQLLQGPLWNGDEYDTTGKTYYLNSGWTRSSAPGVFATDDFDESNVVDNQIPPVAVNVHVHIDLRPIARSS